MMISANSPGKATASPMAAVGGSAAPTPLLTWNGPINDPVTITLNQTVSKTDPLRTGSYSKTLTFTLSTTTP